MTRVVLIVALLITGCATRSQYRVDLATDQFIKAFLTAWLVDAHPVDTFMSADFGPPTSDAVSELWPPDWRNFSARQRSVEFGKRCGVPCVDLTSCVRRASVLERGLYDVEVISVTEEMSGEFPALKDRVGQDVVQVVFVIRGCNIGAYVLIAREPSGQHRVESITYLAP